MKHLVSLAAVAALIGAAPAIAAETKPASPPAAAEKTEKPAPKKAKRKAHKPAPAAETASPTTGPIPYADLAAKDAEMAKSPVGKKHRGKRDSEAIEHHSPDPTQPNQ